MTSFTMVNIKLYHFKELLELLESFLDLQSVNILNITFVVFYIKRKTSRLFVNE